MPIGIERREPVDVAPHALVRRMEDVRAELVDLDARRRIDEGAGIASDGIAGFQHQDGQRKFRGDSFRNRAPRDSGADHDDGKTGIVAGTDWCSHGCGNAV